MIVGAAMHLNAWAARQDQDLDRQSCQHTCRDGNDGDDARMTDAGSSSPPPPSSAPQAKDVAVAALVLNAAAAAAISADAEDGERLPADPAPTPVVPDGRSAARHAVMPRRRPPIRQPRGVPPSARASGSGNPAHLPAHEAARDAVEEHPPPETRSELRDWIKDNATLLSNASLLISLAAVALSLLPDVGIFSPYIKALIFAAAFLLLTELHHQWPEDLQLHMLRKDALPENHSWRMTAFALVMQVATILFAAWAILTNPIILLPLTALAVFLPFIAGISAGIVEFSPGFSESSP